jgi:hypothetical protein
MSSFFPLSIDLFYRLLAVLHAPSGLLFLHGINSEMDRQLAAPACEVMSSIFQI